MGLFDSKGLYAGYDKNNKERAALDYYATPPEEVTNILETLSLDFHNRVILEPCCGGGHMYKGMQQYFINHPDKSPDAICATDIQNRCSDISFPHFAGKNFDYLSDDYDLPLNCPIDYIIMNPPYKLIEPFVSKSLNIAKRGVLMLARLQFLEGKNRYETIHSKFPPSDVYVYVDRIKCYKNGEPKSNDAAIQAFAWYYWDMIHKTEPRLHWIRRADKNDIHG